MPNLHTEDLARAYPEAICAWLPFGRTGFERVAGDLDLGRYGPTSSGALAIEATVLYAFVLGLAAADDAFDLSGSDVDADACRDDALAAFRYCLQTHASSPTGQLDDVPWGGSGMSPKMADQLALAAEVMHGLLSDEDRARLASLIEYEADANILLPWHLEAVDHGYYRRRPPVPAARHGTSYPESNAWRANILGRALLADPDHDHAGQWRESMLLHLANSLSVPADAEDGTIWSGRPIRVWHVGANLHPSFAMEHHGFFHPGYVNRTLLSLFSAWHAWRDAGEEPPDLLLRHVPEVWAVQRRLLLWDGRLAFPAGQDYPRYLWGQLYLLPVLTFMRRQFGCEIAAQCEARAAALLLREQECADDGSFCARRLEAWRREIESPEDVPARSPAPSVYYRSQVDAPFYAGLAWWWGRREGAAGTCPDDGGEPLAEPACGLVLHRGERRFASWSWRACGAGAQGLIIPRDGDHIAEWEGNLLSRFHMRDGGAQSRVLDHTEHTFPGGFATVGRLAAGDDRIMHHVAFIALPDGQTCVHLSRAWTLEEIDLLLHEGLCLNVANDLFNGNRRVFHSEGGPREIEGVGAERHEVHLSSPWVNVDDLLGMAALDGREHFTVAVNGTRQACGHSLCYDRIVHPYDARPRVLQPGSALEDSAVALIADVDAATTARWPAWHVGPARTDTGLRAFTVRGMNDRWYLVAANSAPQAADTMMPLTMEASDFEVLVGDPEQFVLVGLGAMILLPPGGILVTALAGSDYPVPA